MEVRRRVVHIGFGLGVMVMLALSAAVPYGHVYVEAFLMAGFFVGVVIIDQKLKGKGLVVVDTLLKFLERPYSLPAHGAFWYGLGTLLVISFSRNIMEMQAALLLLALGDGFSTLIGKLGKIPLPHNPKKTLEGSIAFFAAGILSVLFVGISGLVLSLIAAVVESTNLRIDDNFLIPLVCVLFFRLLGAGI